MPKTSPLILALIVPALLPAVMVFSSPAQAAYSLADRLTDIRGKVVDLESGLLESLKSQKKAKDNVKKIHLLMALQRQERDLGRKRLGELESKVIELEARRGILGEKIKKQQQAIHRSLAAVENSVMVGNAAASAKVRSLKLAESEKLEAPRRKVLANLVELGLKEVEALKIDLTDADQLETRIQEEKQQLAYLFQDLREQESILELNRQLQADLIQKKHAERLSQLENYRKLKSAEQQVEHLIGQFNARLELERATESERLVTRTMRQGVFSRLKGRLPMPIGGGKVISAFGRGFDPKSRLYIFKKGIDISAAKNAEVQAVSAGKIAYSGELRDYGRVTIVDHGDHYYSLYAHLGEMTRKAGDPVKAGELIGLTDGSGTPMYFEIRARNVAVNPLQWVSN